MQEIEVKYRLSGPDERARLRDRLRVLAAEPGNRVREENLLFDHPDGSLRAADRVLRVRVIDGGPAGELTYKGPAQQHGILKQRIEWQTAVADTTSVRAILTGLGYQPTIRYAKERELWHLAGAEVALDALAFGYFCEIEGPTESISRAAAALGLADSAVEPATYPELAEQDDIAGLTRATP